MVGEILSLSVQGKTVMFTTFPDSLRGVGHLFYLKDRTDIRSSCYPEIAGSNTIYVCGSNEAKDRRKLDFNTVEQTKDFLSSLEEFCLDRGISFSSNGRMVLGRL